jgi:hypothetical protein
VYVSACVSACVSAYVSVYVSACVYCYLSVYILKRMSSTLAGSLVVSAILYSQYTEFHLEYTDYDLRTVYLPEILLKKSYQST